MKLKAADYFKAFVLDGIEAADYRDAAAFLGCKPAAIKAVAMVESPMGLFDGDPNGSFDIYNRPLILYERHVFARNTDPKGKYDVEHPGLSGFRKPYGPGGYGTYAAQYDKLERAYTLDPEAALKACSWGAFQILAENYAACGFGDVESFVTKMCRSESAQLDILCTFINGNQRLLHALRREDWVGFSYNFNGPDYRLFGYDTKFVTAFETASKEFA